MTNPQAIIDNLMKLSSELSKLNKQLADVADKKAESERDYRVALAKEISKLKIEGMQVTLIPDVAKGNVAEYKHERDKWEVMYDVIRDQIRTTRDRISVGQSILNWYKAEFQSSGLQTG